MSFRLHYNRNFRIQIEDFATLAAAILRCHALIDDDTTDEHEILDSMGLPLLLSTDLRRLRFIRQKLYG
jgi:hypothetical protein